MIKFITRGEGGETYQHHPSPDHPCGQERNSECRYEQIFALGQHWTISVSERGIFSTLENDRKIPECPSMSLRGEREGSPAKLCVSIKKKQKSIS